MVKRSDAFDVEWDDRKNRLNQTKHAVSFEEAATILLDPFEIAIEDPGHSILNIGLFRLDSLSADDCW